ncbi:MAG: hypothetical protein ABSB01_13985 [Streptosporangiaceae bacterium]
MIFPRLRQWDAVLKLDGDFHDKAVSLRGKLGPDHAVGVLEPH